jgi:putative nucleotidyltransferase with HDIG domain
MVVLGSIDDHGSPPVAVAGATDHTRSGYMEFEIENELYQAFCWDIYLKQHFHLDKWRIVLGEKDKEIFAPIANFKKTFFRVISLAILTVGFLSIIEIRRSLEPLNVLSESSRHIANGDFTYRANVTSNDEFEELADSFNLMTNRLAKQFADLESQANITRTVLAALDRNRVIATILDEFPNIFRCDSINLILLEEMHPGLASIYTRERGDGELRSVSTHLDNAELEELYSNHVLLNKEISRDSPRYLSNMEEEGIAACCIFPIFMSRGLAGAVVLGYNHSIVLRDDEVMQIRQLTDYLAVALENAELVSKLEKLNIGTLMALARKIAVKIGREMNLTKEQLDDLRKGGLLHDIGKIAIPFDILDKPGKLSDKEFEIIKKHVNYGVSIIEPIYSYRDIIPIIQQHHERIDGSGYPYGLTGAEISLYARILAVADVYDAMTSDRPYRRAVEHSKTLELIRNDAGKKYDPVVVDAFIRSFGEHVAAEEEPVGTSRSVDRGTCNTVKS